MHGHSPFLVLPSTLLSGRECVLLSGSETAGAGLGEGALSKAGHRHHLIGPKHYSVCKPGFPSTVSFKEVGCFFVFLFFFGPIFLAAEFSLFLYFQTLLTWAKFEETQALNFLALQ